MNQSQTTIADTVEEEFDIGNIVASSLGTGRIVEPSTPPLNRLGVLLDYKVLLYPEFVSKGRYRTQKWLMGVLKREEGCGPSERQGEYSWQVMDFYDWVAENGYGDICTDKNKDFLLERLVLMWGDHFSGLRNGRDHLEAYKSLPGPRAMIEIMDRFSWSPQQLIEFLETYLVHRKEIRCSAPLDEGGIVGPIIPHTLDIV